MNRTYPTALLLLCSIVSPACGHTKDEWKVQIDEYGALQIRSDAKQAELERELDAAKRRVDELERELEARGADVSKMSSTLEARERALREDKGRARQLVETRARFDLLTSKLEELKDLGLSVEIRRNRLVISLPADVVFASGKDTLRKDGKELLKKIAAVIRSEKVLLDRDYQVAGHTDSQPYRHGPFQDNWGLSLMRARAVLLYLVSKEGQLPPERWSAAGYADTDPVAVGADEVSLRRNRRCDIIVMPDVDGVSE